mmetsp:Transcript_1056/g.2524  ORF Transcript_1056/g.2524 Transcript_1056/m.2524 type:complete len:315 (+) Transcript_1056:1144-2088(+)
MLRVQLEGLLVAGLQARIPPIERPVALLHRRLAVLEHAQRIRTAAGQLGCGLASVRRSVRDHDRRSRVGGSLGEGAQRLRVVGVERHRGDVHALVAHGVEADVLAAPAARQLTPHGGQRRGVHDERVHVLLGAHDVVQAAEAVLPLQILAAQQPQRAAGEQVPLLVDLRQRRRIAGVARRYATQLLALLLEQLQRTLGELVLLGGTSRIHCQQPLMQRVLQRSAHQRAVRIAHRLHQLASQCQRRQQTTVAELSGGSRGGSGRDSGGGGGGGGGGGDVALAVGHEEAVAQTLTQHVEVGQLRGVDRCLLLVTRG